MKSLLILLALFSLNNFSQDSYKSSICEKIGLSHVRLPENKDFDSQLFLKTNKGFQKFEHESQYSNFTKISEGKYEIYNSTFGEYSSVNTCELNLRNYLEIYNSTTKNYSLYKVTRKIGKIILSQVTFKKKTLDKIKANYKESYLPIFSRNIYQLDNSNMSKKDSLRLIKNSTTHEKIVMSLITWY